MRKVAFLTRSFDEFNQWAIEDKKIYAKIVNLIKDIQRDPFLRSFSNFPFLILLLLLVQVLVFSFN